MPARRIQPAGRSPELIRSAGRSPGPPAPAPAGTRELWIASRVLRSHAPPSRLDAQVRIETIRVRAGDDTAPGRRSPAVRHDVTAFFPRRGCGSHVAQEEDRARLIA